MSTLIVRCCRSLTEGLSKKLDRFPFQVYLKSRRATEVMSRCLETGILNTRENHGGLSLCEVNCFVQM